MNIRSNRYTNMRRFRSVMTIVPLLFLLLTISLLVPYNLVHFTVANGSSSLVQQNNGGCATTGCSPPAISFLSPVTSGDVIVVAIASYSGTVISLTDTLGSSFSQAAFFSNGPMNTYIYYATLSSSGSDSVSVSMYFENIQAGVYIYEISGVTASGAVTAGGTGTCSSSPCSVSTSSSASFQSGNFLLGIVGTGSTVTTTPGSGFTLSPASGVTTLGGYSEYSTSGVTSPTNFPLSLASSSIAWAEAGIALPSSSASTSTTTSTSTSTSTTSASTASSTTTTTTSSTTSFSNDQVANLVVGQPDFASGACAYNPPTATGECSPYGVAFDSSHNLWVVDEGNNRILEYPSSSLGGNGPAASIALGVSTLTTAICTASYPTSTTPGACLGDIREIAFNSSGYLFVSDHSVEGIVSFKPPFSTNMNGYLILGGQGCSSTQSSICQPDGMVFDSSGNLWVTDGSLARVLEFTPPFTPGELASVVIGQADYTSRTCVTSSLASLCGPKGIAFDKSGNLWVSDYGSDRVLEFKPPFTPGMSASLVIGTGTCTAPTASSLCGPRGIAFDSSGNLWVADSGYNRALEFAPPFTSGATIVLGQSDFTSELSQAASQTTFGHPEDIAFDASGNLWLSDNSNSRVLEFLNSQTTSSTTTTTSTSTTTLSTTSLSTSTTSTSLYPSSNEIFALGGTKTGTPTTATEGYDPNSNWWAQYPAMNYAVTGLGAVYDSHNGLVYALGGTDSTGIMTTYNQVYNSVALGNPWGLQAPLLTAVTGLSAVYDSQNYMIYALGGTSSGGVVNSNQEYNPSTNAWNSGPSMQVAVKGVAAVYDSQNGNIYVLGGTDSTGTVVSTVQEFEVASNAWYQTGGGSSGAAPMLTAATNLTAVYDSQNGMIYAIGGENQAGTPLSNVQEFNPSTNSWNSAAAISTPVYGAATVYDPSTNLIYVSGGTIVSGPTDILQIFDPSTNLWSRGAAILEGGSAVTGLAAVYVPQSSTSTTSSSSTTTTTITPSTTLSCPPFVVLGPPAPCIATVTGSSPTGTITFNLISGPGSFLSSTCTLIPMGDNVHSFCPGTFQATSAGTASMSASYSGDSNNPSSASSTVTLTIKKATTFTSVVCSPTDVASTSQSITCTATVNFLPGPGIPTPTGSVSFSGSPNILAFTPSNGECTVSGSPFPSCSVSFTASSSASISLTASYSGDSNFDASGGSAVVGVGLTASSVTVNGCTSPLAAYPGTCTVTVTGTSPSGLVVFPPTIPVSGPPPFYVPPGCTLSPVSSTSSQCTMTFVDVTPNSSPTVEAVYPGDANNGPSSGIATVTIGNAPSIGSLSVSCTPTTVILGSPTTCTATVAPSSFSGYVFLTAGSIGVSGLPPMTPLMPLFQFCQISGGSCQVGFIGAIPGETYVNAYLPGMSPAQTTTQITVNPGSGSNTVNNGLGDQTFEGNPLDFSSGMPCVNPSACGSISFTPPSGDAGDQFATTFRLLSGTDSGVGSSNLGNPQYGDISISATSGGSSSNTLVNVCLPDTSADSKTILQYWDTSTSSWVTASNIVVTPGVKVCGDIPLSALNGRNIIGGDPLSPSGLPPQIIQAQVTVYTSYKGPMLLVSASDTISQMHSALYYETLLPQYGYFANGTWGYLGYYYGAFEAISGGQQGLTATVTVTYNGQSLTNETVSAAPGKTSYVDFTFGTASSGSSSSAVVLAPLALFISFPALAAASVSINELWRRRYQSCWVGGQLFQRLSR